jgi:hypothetical protein
MSTSNEVKFEGGQGISTIKFTWDHRSCITDSKPLSVDVNPNDTKKIVVTVTADRNKSDQCIDSFFKEAGGKKTNTIHTEGGDARPDELNFWITGTLVFNSDPNATYQVVLAQGHRRVPNGNNWFIGSPSITAASNNKSGSINLEGAGNPKFAITTDGANTFKIAKIS